MRKHSPFSSGLRHILLLACILLLLGVGASTAAVYREPDSFERSRQQLLAYLLSQQLTRNHFRDQPLDDLFSTKAFSLYLQQLDSQKRFLLKEDVELLRDYKFLIDDEMLSGRLNLPHVGADLHRRRIDDAELLVQEILEKGFDVHRGGQLQTDPEQLDYCRDQNELRERWRKALKYQVLNRYLDTLGERRPELADLPEMPADYSVNQTLLEEAVTQVAQSVSQLFTRLRQTPRQEYIDRYFDAVCRAFDPHTNYLAPADEEEFEISMKGALEGIGATLQQADGHIKVVSIIPGSPAARQGQLEAEDVILKVAEGSGEPVDIVDSRLRDAVRLIRGKKGTEVRLTVRKPTGEQQVIAILRDVVQIEESFVRSTLLQGSAEREGRFGYIRIPTFYRDFFGRDDEGSPRNCTDDVRAALESFQEQDVKGLVLDLRNNGGGSLTDAVQIAGLFIDMGPVVQVKNSAGQLAVLRDKDPGVAFDGPMVVLVNRFSASASEILAAVLQDYRRALVVGDHGTHGKGTVQTVLDLDRAVPAGSMEQYRPLGAMKLTLQKFYRVSGGSTQELGVEPDVLLPGPLPLMDSGERFSENALPWDTIAPVSFTPWRAEPFALDDLREASRLRVAASPRFQALEEMRRQRLERGEMTERPLHIAELWQERNRARSLRQIGERDVEAEDEKDSAETETWLRRLADDIHVHEALEILNDLRIFENGNTDRIGEQRLAG